MCSKQLCRFWLINVIHKVYLDISLSLSLAPWEKLNENWMIDIYLYMKLNRYINVYMYSKRLRFVNDYRVNLIWLIDFGIFGWLCLCVCARGKKTKTEEEEKK